MSYANDIIEKLFGGNRSENRTEKAKPLVLDSGQIKRSQDQRNAYNDWQKTCSQDFFFEVKQNAIFSQKNLTEAFNFIWFDASTANGFQFDLSEVKTPLPEAWFALEAIKEKINTLGYSAANAEFSVSEIDDLLCRKEWIYLKTPYQTRIGKPPYAQRFGNIQLEMNQQKKSTIKLLATTYSDRNYLTPQPFEELVEALFY